MCPSSTKHPWEPWNLESANCVSGCILDPISTSSVSRGRLSRLVPCREGSVLYFVTSLLGGRVCNIMVVVCSVAVSEGMENVDQLIST